MNYISAISSGDVEPDHVIALCPRLPFFLLSEQCERSEVWGENKGFLWLRRQESGADKTMEVLTLPRHQRLHPSNATL